MPSLERTISQASQDLAHVFAKSDEGDKDISMHAPVLQRAESLEKSRSASDIFSMRLRQFQLYEYDHTCSPRKRLSADFSDGTYSSESFGESPTYNCARVASVVNGPFLTGPIVKEFRKSQVCEVKSPRSQEREEMQKMDLQATGLHFSPAPKFGLAAQADFYRLPTIDPRSSDMSSDNVVGVADCGQDNKSLSYSDSDNGSSRCFTECQQEIAEATATDCIARSESLCPPGEATNGFERDVHVFVPKKEMSHTTKCTTRLEFPESPADVLRHHVQSVHHHAHVGDITLLSTNGISVRQTRNHTVTDSQRESTKKTSDYAAADARETSTRGSAYNTANTGLNGSDVTNSIVFGDEEVHETFYRLTDVMASSMTSIMPYTRGKMSHDQLELASVIRKVQTQLQILASAGQSIRLESKRNAHKLQEANEQRRSLEAHNTQLELARHHLEQERHLLQQQISDLQMVQNDYIRSSFATVDQRLQESETQIMNALGQLKQNFGCVQNDISILPKLVDVVNDLVNETRNLSLKQQCANKLQVLDSCDFERKRSVTDAPVMKAAEVHVVDKKVQTSKRTLPWLHIVLVWFGSLVIMIVAVQFLFVPQVITQRNDLDRMDVEKLISRLDSLILDRETNLVRPLSSTDMEFPPTFEQGLAAINVEEPKAELGRVEEALASIDSAEQSDVERSTLLDDAMSIDFVEISERMAEDRAIVALPELLGDAITKASSDDESKFHDPYLETASDLMHLSSEFYKASISLVESDVSMVGQPDQHDFTTESGQEKIERTNRQSIFSELYMSPTQASDGQCSWFSEDKTSGDDTGSIFPLSGLSRALQYLNEFYAAGLHGWRRNEHAVSNDPSIMEGHDIEESHATPKELKDQAAGSEISMSDDDGEQIDKVLQTQDFQLPEVETQAIVGDHITAIKSSDLSESLLTDRTIGTFEVGKDDQFFSDEASEAPDHSSHKRWANQSICLPDEEPEMQLYPPRVHFIGCSLRKDVFADFLRHTAPRPTCVADHKRYAPLSAHKHTADDSSSAQSSIPHLTHQEDEETQQLVPDADVAPTSSISDPRSSTKAIRKSRANAKKDSGSHATQKYFKSCHQCSANHTCPAIMSFFMAALEISTCSTDHDYALYPITQSISSAFMM